MGIIVNKRTMCAFHFDIEFIGGQIIYLTTLTMIVNLDQRHMLLFTCIINVLLRNLS